MLFVKYRHTALLGLALSALTLGGCVSSSETTGSIAARSATAQTNPSMNVERTRTDAEWQQLVKYWQARYDKEPKNPSVMLNYATSLRGVGQRSQAVALLQQAAILHPKQPQILAAYGRALAESGNLEEALKVLERAHQPERPDWRILNAQGAILDQLGKFSNARQYYLTALKTNPNESAILSNLGLSYALSEQLPEAEKILRQAVQNPDATPKMRQNLVLVLSLQGKFKEAEELARQDLSPEAARENVAYWRQAMSQKNKWQTMRENAPSNQALEDSSIDTVARAM